ncbi:hypothetical protein EV191_111124 [Tamaricihabitans halophyticus]|uniref:DNA-binding transcriptional regulator of glucitol operon n=2 Tax=Tamaricihabitans halophyticus TaxID=1262583 RepID=A0A4R2QGT8_9PSEU|nr:transcriptional regulator [Tamaricihabitans halophyticus]TCP47919.1 hypothetical protein EV191_111124 [Tamaricihabitans halophyticus]
MIVSVSVLSVLVCCALAAWQLERFLSAGGSYQNLGYVLLWPLFGLFPAFMFWRLRRLRQAEETSDDEGHSEKSATSVSAPRQSFASRLNRTPPPLTQTAARQTPIAPDPADSEDVVLAEYNRYLAELGRRANEGSA